MAYDLYSLPEETGYDAVSMYMEETDVAGIVDSMAVEEDVTLQHLREHGLDYVDELADERGDRYVEAYLDEALETLTQRFQEIGLDASQPDVAYRPEIAEDADADEQIPLAIYNSSDDTIEVIRSPDEDRVLEPSLLGVMAHELWHCYFEHQLRDTYGFVSGQRPDIPGTAVKNAVNGYGLAGASNDGKSGYNLDMAMTDDLYGDIYGDGMQTTVLDPTGDEATELEVDESMPDVHLGGLDEAFAHIITLAVEDGLHDEELREAYWERVASVYNQQDEKYGLYEDRTGRFGDEITVLGEQLATRTLSTAGSPVDSISDLEPLLTASLDIIEDGLLAVSLER